MAERSITAVPTRRYLLYRFPASGDGNKNSNRELETGTGMDQVSGKLSLSFGFLPGAEKLAADGGPIYL